MVHDKDLKMCARCFKKGRLVWFFLLTTVDGYQAMNLPFEQGNIVRGDF